MASGKNSKYIDYFELLDLQNTSIAIADEDLKITWYNKSFKKNSGSNRIKGVSLTTVFGINLPDEFDVSNFNKSLIIPLPDSGKNIVLTLIPPEKRNFNNTFFIELIPVIDQQLGNKDLEILQRNIKFQNELRSILMLLVKENSLAVVSEEILIRCVNITGSDFGIIVLQEDDDIKGFLYADTAGFLKNKDEIEKSIIYNSSFINKWLEINRRPLLAVNQFNNIGYGLTQVMQSESMCISPCYFENKLKAKLIIGKKTGDYSSIEISNIEQFSILLSFAVSSIKTRELNTALESRLLQAQKLETIGKLSSGMAHDFSNLLSGIFGSVNLLRNRVPESENITRLIDNIETCSIRARDLTKGLLSFGKPTAKRKELVLPNVLLDELSKVIVQTFPHNISFQYKINEKLYNILGNATEIYQIILNLCVNAKEAIDGKGKIFLSAKNITIDDSNIAKYPLIERGNYVLLSVSDNGTGISEEHITRIFDPYFSTKQKDTGSGLGLYVTYGIIKAHNGYIDVTSTKGDGTTFDVYLPAYEPQKSDRTLIANKIIMLADDEEMLSELLSELLELNGYNVIRVNSGEEVLKVLTEEIKVDLLIIDYNMPVMNGIECIAELRKLNFKMPVILSSGSLNIDDLLLETYDIKSKLSKPYDFETMLSTIQKLI
jgi:signal transduction histidine kinase